MPRNPLQRAPRLLWLWAIFFLLVNSVMEMRGGTNPHSRYALLCALSEDHSIRIDSYAGMTVDWARKPDGHYYSNKAPGPALIAFPIFWLVDKAATFTAPDRATRDWRRTEMRWHVEHVLSILLQAIPFALLVVWASVWLLDAGASDAAVRFFCAAALFGNTAAMYMNTFFGHGMTAAAVLALALCLWRRRYAWAGFCFGLSVLCDFGSAMLLPATLLALVMGTRRPRDWLYWAAGGIGPGLVWSVYHCIAFGSPFTLPTQFQNPAFVDRSQPHVWGVIDWMPHASYAYELLFGNTRGLLFTQPWVLIAVLGLVVLLAKRQVRRPEIAALALFGLGGLFVMNAAFGQWHAGNTPGPRYLCAIFPTLALATALAYDSFARGARLLLWIGLVAALAYFAIVFSTTLDAEPGVALWTYYGTWLANGHWKTLCARGPLLIGGWGWLFTRRPKLVPAT